MLFTKTIYHLVIIDMSNPGVITLDSEKSKKDNFKRFEVEDNIGESIHLHIDNMRIDFTINEFLDFSKLIKESIAGLDVLAGYSLDQFDAYFLKECGDILPGLAKIKIEEIELSELKCIVCSSHGSDLNLKKIVGVNETPAYKYLSGDKDSFISYSQHNYFTENNEGRLAALLESIKNNGYPNLGRYIVVFDGQNYIRDGQHRAAILSYLYGADTKVKVMRFYFENKKHLIREDIGNIKVICFWFVKKVYRTTKKICKVLLRILNI